METPKRYIQVFINSEADCPKTEGEYFCNRNGFNSVQHLMTTLGKSYMREIRWYLLPESDKPEGKSAEELSSNDIDIIVGILTQYGHFDMAADLMEKYNNLIIKLYKSQSKGEDVMVSDEDISNTATEYANKYGGGSFGEYYHSYCKGAKAMRDGKIKPSLPSKSERDVLTKFCEYLQRGYKSYATPDGSMDLDEAFKFFVPDNEDIDEFLRTNN